MRTPLPRLLPLYLLLLAFVIQASAEDPVRRIVLVAVGHSNMRGEGETAVKPEPHVSFWDSQRHDWAKLSKGEGFYTLRDPMTPLANLISQKYPNVEIGVLKVIENGSNLHDNWHPGKRTYVDAVKYTKEIQERGDIVACLFPISGWREAGRFGNEKSNRTVLEDYKTFLNAFRQDVGIPDLPVVASQVEAGFTSKEFSGMEAWQRVYDAIAKLPAALPKVAVVEVKDLATKPNDHHFTSASNTEWSKRALVGVESLQVMERALALAKRAAPMAVSNKRPQAIHDEKDVAGDLEAIVSRVTKPRALSALGTYKNLMAINEYEVKKSVSGQFKPGDTILVVEQVVQDKKALPAYTRATGQKMRLQLGWWEAQKKLKSEALDDGILDLDRPLYFALSAQPE